MSEDEGDNFYVNHAEMVYEMARKERWPQSEIFEFLKNPSKFEAFMQNVSLFPANIFSEVRAYFGSLLNDQ